MGDLLKEKKWIQVYSSDLPRAATSCDLILTKSQHWEEEKASSSISRLPLLRELSFGLREGLSRSLTLPEVRRIRAQELNIQVEDLIDTAESSEGAKQRQHEFIKQLHRDLRDHPLRREFEGEMGGERRGIPVLCVSHGGFIRLFLKHYCKLPSVEKIKNCAASLITISWEDEVNDESYACSADIDEVNLCPLTTSFVP